MACHTIPWARKILIACPLLLLVSVSSALAPGYVLHEERQTPFTSTIERRRLDPNVPIPVRIGLKQNEESMANAEAWLMSVSDPDSKDYGRFWTQDEVIELFKPTDDTLKTVTDWLSSNGVEEFTHSDNKLFFAFDAPTSQVERMLQTKVYAHSRSDSPAVLAACDQYYLPDYLRQHIDYITPGVRESDITDRVQSEILGRSAATRQPIRDSDPDISSRAEIAALDVADPESLENCSQLVTPACIRALYGVPLPDPDKAVSSNNSLGIFALWDINIQRPLNHFFKTLTDIPRGTSPKVDRIDGATSRGWSQETEVDVECAWPVIYPQNITIYQTPKPPRNSHTKLDFFNQFLDAIDGSFCDYLPQSDGSHHKLQCGTFQPDNVISVSYGTIEFEYPRLWRERQCNEYLKLGLQGVTVLYSSGDAGANLVDPVTALEVGLPSQKPYECHVKPGKNVFMADFPTSCPWLTSIGGTQIGRGNTVDDREEAAEFSSRGHVPYTEYSSGGGFSATFPAPLYQKAATSRYFEVADVPWPHFSNGEWRNSTGVYNQNGRGVPDIAAVSKKIASFFDHYEHPRGASGTSTSAPIVAGLLNRIVEERLRVGKGPIGFVNPTFYKHPEMFNDVVKGGNYKNHWCIAPARAFEATEGWDPVTGLGTPDYPKLLERFMKLP